MTTIHVSTVSDTAALAGIWRASVRATDDFLVTPTSARSTSSYRAVRPYPLLHMRQE